MGIEEKLLPEGVLLTTVSPADRMRKVGLGGLWWTVTTGR